MISIKRINKEDVKPVTFIDEKKDDRPVKGRDLFPEVYANIFFCARKKSGKSCAIAHIIDKCSTSETRVIAFVSTLRRDPTWRTIQAMCEKKKIEFTGYTSIKDESSKEDILSTIVRTLEETCGDGKEDEEESASAPCPIIVDTDEDPRGKKPKKPKEKAPKIIFVFDDLSGELQSPSLTQLLKKNRHFKCKVLLSSQYWNDIALQGRKQIDYVLLYRGLAQSMSKLEDIYKNCDLSCPFEVFVSVYRYCTAKKFNFMYIDVVDSVFRKNFSHKIGLPEEVDLEEERDL
jgi:hypothetical protein